MLKIRLKGGAGIKRLRPLCGRDVASRKEGPKVVDDLLLDVLRGLQDLLLTPWPRAGQPGQPHRGCPLSGHMKDCVLLCSHSLLPGPNLTAPKPVAVLLCQAAPQDHN